MTLHKILPGVLLLAGLIQAQTNFTLRDLINDPGLDINLYKEKDYRWTPDGRSLLFFNKSGTAKTFLVRQNLDQNSQDTLFVSDSLIWRESEQNLIMDYTGYKVSPHGNLLLMTAKNDLFIYDCEQKRLQRLTADGKSKILPCFSPDGRYLSFVRENNLWIGNCATGNQTQLTSDGSETLLNGRPDWVYEEEFDITTAYIWSADSRYIAFLQFDETEVGRYPLMDWKNLYPSIEWQYYPKAGEKIPDVRVFSVDITTKEIVHIKRALPRNEYVVRIDWLPDTNLVMIQSLNRQQNYKKISLGNPKTGETKLILEEKDSYWLNVTDMYYCLKNRRQLIYYSERDGNMHLYLYDYDGKLIKQLTAGAWIVTELNGVDEANDLVYFTATQKSVLERHLYRLNLQSGAMSQVDSLSGTHHVIIAPDFNRYLDYFSDVKTPTCVLLGDLQSGGVRPLWANPQFDYTRYQFGETRFLEINAMDGTKLNASLLVPPDYDPQKKYPVLVYVYGGPHYQIVTNTFTTPFLHWLAREGYLIFRLDGRGSSGRDRNWERKISLQLGKQELQDLLDGIKYLKTLPYVDANRIGIYGASYGGYMTLLALCKAPDVFRVGVSVAPVTHWKYYDAIYTERYLGLPKDRQQDYFESAPLNFVTNLKARLLLVHGSADDNVHFQQSINFVEELIRNNKRFELLIYPNRKHGIRDAEGRLHLYETISDFLNRSL